MEGSSDPRVRSLGIIDFKVFLKTFDLLKLYKCSCLFLCEWLLGVFAALMLSYSAFVMSDRNASCRSVYRTNRGSPKYCVSVSE